MLFAVLRMLKQKSQNEMKRKHAGLSIERQMFIINHKLDPKTICFQSFGPLYRSNKANVVLLYCENHRSFRSNSPFRFCMLPPQSGLACSIFFSLCVCVCVLSDVLQNDYYVIYMYGFSSRLEPIDGCVRQPTKVQNKRNKQSLTR